MHRIFIKSRQHVVYCIEDWTQEGCVNSGNPSGVFDVRQIHHVSSPRTQLLRNSHSVRVDISNTSHQIWEGSWLNIKKRVTQYVVLYFFTQSEYICSQAGSAGKHTMKWECFAASISLSTLTDSSLCAHFKEAHVLYASIPRRARLKWTEKLHFSLVVSTVV